MIFPYFPIVIHEFSVPKPKEVKMSGLMVLVDKLRKNEAKEFVGQVTEKRKNIQNCLKAKPKRYSECAEEIRDYLRLVQAFKISSVKDFIRGNLYFVWRSGLQNSKKRRIQYKSLLFEEIMMSWLYGICLINSCRQILKRAASRPSKESILSPSKNDEYHLHVIRALRLAGGVFSSLSLDLIPSFHRDQLERYPVSRTPSPQPTTPNRKSPFTLRKKKTKSNSIAGFSAHVGISEQEYLFEEPDVNFLDKFEDPLTSRNRARNSSGSSRKSNNELFPPFESSSSSRDGEVKVSFFELDALSAYAVKCYCTAAAQMIKLYSISTGMIRKREKIEKSYSLSNSPQTPQNLIRRRRKRMNQMTSPLGGLVGGPLSSPIGPPKVGVGNGSHQGGGEDSSVWIANVAVKIYRDLDECFVSLRTLQHKKKYLDKKMEVDHSFWLNISQYRIVYRAVTLQQMAIHHYNVDNFGLCCGLISLSLRQIKEIQVFRVIRRNQMFLKEIEKFVYSIALLERKYFHENKIFFQAEIIEKIPKQAIPPGKALITIKPHHIDSSSSQEFWGYLKELHK